MKLSKPYRRPLVCLKAALVHEVGVGSAEGPRGTLRSPLQQLVLDSSNKHQSLVKLTTENERESEVEKERNTEL